MAHRNKTKLYKFYRYKNDSRYLFFTVSINGKKAKGLMWHWIRFFWMSYDFTVELARGHLVEIPLEEAKQTYPIAFNDQDKPASRRSNRRGT